MKLKLKLFAKTKIWWLLGLLGVIVAVAAYASKYTYQEGATGSSAGTGSGSTGTIGGVGNQGIPLLPGVDGDQYTIINQVTEPNGATTTEQIVTGPNGGYASQVYSNINGAIATTPTAGPTAGPSAGPSKGPTAGPSMEETTVQRTNV